MFAKIKPEREAWFFEPEVNSKILDGILWHIPIGGRPSKFDKIAFEKWKESDPHPDRSFSSKHWGKAGKEFFREVQIIPVGTLERFSRFFGWGERRNKFKRWALKNERFLLEFTKRPFTRSQLILYRKSSDEARRTGGRRPMTEVNKSSDYDLNSTGCFGR